MNKNAELEINREDFREWLQNSNIVFTRHFAGDECPLALYLNTLTDGSTHFVWSSGAVHMNSIKIGVLPDWACKFIDAVDTADIANSNGLSSSDVIEVLDGIS